MSDHRADTEDRNVPSKIPRKPDPHRFPRAVVAGDAIANANILQACRRHLHDLERDDLYWDHDEWNAYCNLVADLRIVDGHELTGQPVEILDWQAWVIGSMLCWRKKDGGGRRYRSGFVEVARGAGKTTMSATMLLHVASYRPGVQCAILANTVQQALEAYNAARAFAVDAYGDHHDPDEADTAKYECTERHIKCRATKGRIFTRAAKSSTLDGMKADAYLVDESSEQTSDWMSKIQSGLGKKRDTFMLSVTTPGGLSLGRDSPYYVRRAVAVQALKEDQWDELDTFAALFGLDDDDDMLDERTWMKAQPSLHHVIPIGTYRQQLKEYQAQAKLSDWERFQMCRFTTRNLSWIDSDLWLENTGDVELYPSKATKVYAAVDFSKSFDLTSLAWGWWAGERFHMRWHHWAIRKEAGDMSRDYQRHLEKWETYDNVTVCENAVQYSSVRDKLRQIQQATNLVKVGYDAMGGMKLSVQEWEDELNMVPFPQSIVSMGPSTYLMESLIRDRRLTMQSCPVVDYALSCVALEENVNGDRRVCKKKSTGIVDPIVAGIMVMGILIQEGAERPGAYADGTEIAF